MVIGSHNSWSYATPKKWWMKFVRFTAKCQDVNILKQYCKYNARCFDLRVNWLGKNTGFQVVHNKIVYNLTHKDIMEDLRYLNGRYEMVRVRVILDIRDKNKLDKIQTSLFREFCIEIQNKFPTLYFFGGNEFVTGERIYNFGYDVTIDSKYASVEKPKYIDDLYPRIYAKLNNRKNIAKGTDKDCLMIDFVNIK